MFTSQLGQAISGAVLSLGVMSGLGLTASPVISDFIKQAERNAFMQTHKAFKTSLEVNHLIMQMNIKRKMIIQGQEVRLKYGYPVATRDELEKLVELENYTSQKNASDSLVIWSSYESFCFTYKEASKNSRGITPAKITKLMSGVSGNCPA